jgi:hypothetical protein
VLLEGGQVIGRLAVPVLQITVSNRYRILAFGDKHISGYRNALTDLTSSGTFVITV